MDALFWVGLGSRIGPSAVCMLLARPLEKQTSYRCWSERIELGR